MSTISVPFYDNLTVEKMWAFASEHEQLEEYLPDGKDRDELPRAWLANVLNTVLGQAFGLWVREQIEARNAGLKAHSNVEVEMDEEILAIFRASTSVSGKYLAVA